MPTRLGRYVAAPIVMACGLTLGAAPAPAATPTDPTARVAEDVVARVATLNLPGGTTGRFRKLLPQPRRTVAALRSLDKNHIGIAGLQEFSSVSRAAVRQTPNWRAVSAPPNSIRGDNQIGNAVAFRTDVWSLQRADHVHVPVADRRPEGLNMAVAVLRRRGTSQRLVVMSAHHPVPSERNAKKIKKRSIEAELRYANRIRRSTGYPVVIAADANDRSASQRYVEGGHTVGVQRNIDMVVGRGLQFEAPRVKVEGIKGRLTDHPLVSVQVRITR